MSPAAWAGIQLIRGYRRFVSPFLGDNCRFYPSCSQYAQEALAVHGFLKGSLLSLVRICKCAPWHPGGCDPVPPAGEWKAGGAYLSKDGE